MNGGLIPNLDTGSIPVSSILIIFLESTLVLRWIYFFGFEAQKHCFGYRKNTDIVKTAWNYSVIFTKKIGCSLWQG